MQRRWQIGRRRWVLGTAALAVGCTSKERRSAPEVERSGRLTRPAGVQPILVVDHGTPVSGSSSCWTLYDDGWATVSAWGGPVIREEDYAAVERTLHVREAVDVVRDLLADPGFAKVEKLYQQEGVRDGGMTVYVGGAPLRRIVVENDPELPAALRSLIENVELLSARTEREGTDPFVDVSLPCRARALVRHELWAGGWRMGADRLTVYEDGLLEYRVTPALRVREESDHPMQSVIVRRCDRGELSDVRAAVLGSGFGTLAFMPGELDVNREHHHFHVGEKHVFRHETADLEAGLRAIVEAVEPLRAELRRDYDAGPRR